MPDATTHGSPSPPEAFTSFPSTVKGAAASGVIRDTGFRLRVEPVENAKCVASTGSAIAGVRVSAAHPASVSTQGTPCLITTRAPAVAEDSATLMPEASVEPVENAKCVASTESEIACSGKLRKTPCPIPAGVTASVKNCTSFESPLGETSGLVTSRASASFASTLGETTALGVDVESPVSLRL